MVRPSDIWPTSQLTTAVGRRRANVPGPRRGGRGQRQRDGGQGPDVGARRAQGRAQDRADPRRARAGPARGEQGARPPAGAHVRAQRELRGGGVQEARRRAVLGAQDPAHQGTGREAAGRVGWTVYGLLPVEMRWTLTELDRPDRSRGQRQEGGQLLLRRGAGLGRGVARAEHSAELLPDGAVGRWHGLH
jgi:hypothetical protein